MVYMLSLCGLYLRLPAFAGAFVRFRKGSTGFSCMTAKTAYFRGPLSTFSTQLAVQLLEDGWNLHIPSKSALNFSLSPLDLRSSIESTLERSIGKKSKARELLERVRLLEPQEVVRGTKYDVIIFCGLPANFDEARVSRAPWAAEELSEVCRRLKDVPVIILSSLWSAIQEDGVVPEEIEFNRRKPLSHFEGVCQQYELKLLNGLENQESLWYLLRLPLVTPKLSDGSCLSFSGLSNLFAKVSESVSDDKVLRLAYNPDATLWMLPCDLAASLTAAFIEDSSRPRICNLVSTRATLNQEWLQHVASAADLQRVEMTERDSLNLPGPLQAMLRDNVQVKTRNLFEVMGRHQETPVSMDADYFAKVFKFGRNANWGQPRTEHFKSLFSEHMATQYFTEFLVARVDEKVVSRMSKFNGGLAFHIEGHNNCAWVVKGVDGNLVVQPYDPVNDTPALQFLFTPGGFVRLLKHEMLFEQALLSKDLQARGKKGLEFVKACDLVRKILKEYNFEYNNNPSAQPKRLQVLQKAGKE